MSFKLGRTAGDPFKQLGDYIDSQLRKLQCQKGCAVISASAPTTADIPTGKYTVWKNTTSGIVTLVFNDNGTLKSTTLS